MDAVEFRERLLINVGSALVLVVATVYGSRLLEFLLPSLPPLAATAVALVLGFAILVAILVLRAVLRPAPMVDLRNEQVRVGRHRFRFDEIDQASVVGVGGWTASSSGVGIRFGPKGRAQATVVLRTADRDRIDDARRERLLQVIERSSIVAPVDPYDPKGRFTHINFPGALDKRSAAELVRDPPSAMGPFPHP